MNIIEKSSNGIFQISGDAKLMSNRKVFIEGEITPETACEFVKKIMILNMQDPDRPIDLLINTPGGCINSGMVYYDVIQASKAPIRTFCIGRAYSMGAILLACGNHGYTSAWGSNDPRASAWKPREWQQLIHQIHFGILAGNET